MPCYSLQQDIKKSLAFYEGVLGMTLIHQAGGDDFTNYFLVFAQEGKSIEEQAETIFDREGVVELCHNHGTESDESFKGYANGNEDPGRGSSLSLLNRAGNFQPRAVQR